MKRLILLLMIFSAHSALFAQLSNEEYKKALWMTARMYGGQRSGEGPNWLIMDHNVSNNGKTRNGVDFINDSDGSYDLSGGWHDCGDHVKFGQTEYYSGYVLLLGYSEFTAGYRDHYSFDYSGYRNSGDFTWEGGHGAPNGIPDILDEVKYATDYFIKCARDANTFYSQVGNGNYDHRNWVTSVYMSTLAEDQGGEPRDILKNPNDASNASFCGATLALMSRVYREFDPTYADLCLQHALYAYEYAKAHPNAGANTITGSFYGPDNDWQDNYVCLCAELYYATGDEAYRTEALSYASAIGVNGWVLDYENTQDLALYHLARFGSSAAETKFAETVDGYYSKLNASNVFDVGGSWGKLRYVANAAFSAALYDKYTNAASIHSGIKGTVDYILGENSANYSFVVGFGANSPQKPHHRNVFLSDANNMDAVSIPLRNRQHGFMVGGTLDPGSFPDDIHDYATSEGGIDYQAGLVGALGYIMSVLDPVPVISSTKKASKELSVIAYPNPFSDHIKFTIPGADDFELTISDLTGTMVFSGSFSGSESIHVPGLEKGVYIATVSTEEATKSVKITRL